MTESASAKATLAAAVEAYEMMSDPRSLARRQEGKRRLDEMLADDPDLARQLDDHVNGREPVAGDAPVDAA